MGKGAKSKGGSAATGKSGKGGKGTKGGGGGGKGAGKGKGRDSPADEVVPSKKQERAKKAELKKRRNKEKHRATDAEDKLFEEQLKKMGLRITPIRGDGNCLFRSIADQLLGDHDKHAQVRKEIVQYMVSKEDLFSLFMEDDETFSDYAERMAGDAEWGGHQELYAASQLYSVTMVVHQLAAPRFEVACEPRQARELHLSYHGEAHYNSVRSEEDSGAGPALPINLASAQASPSGGRGSGGGGGGGDRKKETSSGSGQSPAEELVMRSCPGVDAAGAKRALSLSGGDAMNAVELVLAGGLELEEEEGGREEPGHLYGGEEEGGDGAKEGDAKGGGGRGRDGVAASGAVEGQEETKRRTGESGTGGVEVTKKVARGSACPCGSGLKYKKCCRKREKALKGRAGTGDCGQQQQQQAAERAVGDEFGALQI